jgi:hypothetical protein
MDLLAHYRITINPGALTGAAAAKYSRQVLQHLTWIHRTKMGNALLQSIRFHKLPVEIRPYPTGACNAGGGGETAGGHFAASRPTRRIRSIPTEGAPRSRAARTVVSTETRCCSTS